MLRRSIPGYSSLLHLIGVLAGQVVQPKSNVYDLGCSLGAVTLAVRHGVGARETQIIAVDNSPAMVSRCREIVSADSGLCPVDVFEGDILDFELSQASLVVLNFTLQFAPPEQRARILKRITSALLPGGVLVLSEKTTSDDAALDAFWTKMHDAFRSSNGYTEIEMSRKREALDRVLIPQTPASYEELLRDVGLKPVQWFRSLQFVSWVGKKDP
jgi:tRNA (cmo5U34)-methyltransferase